VKAGQRYIRAVKGWDAWTSVLGIRADERRRLAKISARIATATSDTRRWDEPGRRPRWSATFWRAQPFDLALPNTNGKTMHGNCDCASQALEAGSIVIREKPERRCGGSSRRTRSACATRNGQGEGPAKFRMDRATYAQMHKMAVNSGELFAFDADDESIETATARTDMLERKGLYRKLVPVLEAPAKLKRAPKARDRTAVSARYVTPREGVAVLLLRRRRPERCAPPAIQRGGGQKAPDWLVIALCKLCHQGDHGIHGDKSRMRARKLDEPALLAITIRRLNS